MARHRIVDGKGKPTTFFWSDIFGTDRHHRTVLKETGQGIKRMRRVHLGAEAKKLCKD
ncbi:MAG: hypothetical protein JSU87_14820 [Gemmatimonadota bacterium]|jgi:hypothetical protein|nr:MAG: hypothetical protein JSU87_14820 [Gemmatimonadota bacterium]